MIQSFAVLLKDVEYDDVLENKVYEICPDGLLSACNGQIRIDVDREAPTKAAAIIPVLQGLRAANIPVDRLELGIPADMVTGK